MEDAVMNSEINELVRLVSLPENVDIDEVQEVETFEQ